MFGYVYNYKIFYAFIHCPLSDEASEQPPKPTSAPLFQPSPNTAKKSSQPSKLVDLGAAATFASTAQQQQQQSSGAGDLFGVFEGSSQPQVQTTAQGRCTYAAAKAVWCLVSYFVLLFVLGGGFADFGSAFVSKPEEQQAVGTG